MPSSHIIRIPRTDAEGAFILGEVISSGGSKPLNLKINATEGDAAYSVKLRHDRIHTHLAPSAPCPPSEWESILISLLLPTADAPAPPSIEPGAEISPDGPSLIITIRRRVAGINQRLGTLSLPVSSSEDAIQLFDWCSALALERTQLQSDALAAAARAREREAEVAALRAQLDELVDAKKKQEEELLQKFCVLLNEKKVKIREQQVLLAGVGVEEGAGVPVRGAGVGGAARGGRGKRKVREEESEEEGVAKVEEGVAKVEEEGERMDVDEGGLSEEDGGQMTPEAETETGSEGEEEDGAAARYSFRSSPPVTAAARGGGSGKGKEKAREVTPPAPARAGIAHRTRHAAAVAKPDEGSETESDDEL